LLRTEDIAGSRRRLSRVSRRRNLALIVIAIVAGTVVVVGGAVAPVPRWVGGAGVAAVFISEPFPFVSAQKMVFP
jgi:hypothetical protein